MRPRDRIEATFAVVFGVLLGVWFSCCVLACSAFLTPAEASQVEGTAAIVARCEAEGYACKADAGDAFPTGCYAVYDACMQDAGLLP